MAAAPCGEPTNICDASRRASNCHVQADSRTVTAQHSMAALKALYPRPLRAIFFNHIFQALAIFTYPYVRQSDFRSIYHDANRGHVNAVMDAIL